MKSPSNLTTRPVITSVRSMAATVAPPGAKREHAVLHRFHSFSQIAPPRINETANNVKSVTASSVTSSQVLKRILESGVKTAAGEESQVTSSSQNSSSVISAFLSSTDDPSMPQATGLVGPAPGSVQGRIKQSRGKWEVGGQAFVIDATISNHPPTPRKTIFTL